LLPERFHARHEEHIRRFGETGVTNRTMGKLGTLYGRRSDGAEFQVEASISQVETGEGRLFTVILRDVTQRVKDEELRMESEQQLRSTFEQAAVGIAHIDSQGRFLRVNQKFCELIGYSNDEILTKSISEITHPDDIHMEQELIDRLITGTDRMYVMEKRYIRKDGEVIWASLSVSLVRGAAGEPRYLIKVIDDITERKKASLELKNKNDEIKSMTQQLWQTAKLATMGELAASIAHELNNPLAILSLRIESLLSKLPEGDPTIPELAIMQEEADRMAVLVGNLLQFSRAGTRQISSLDVRDELDNTLELIHSHLLHRKVVTERRFSADVPLIHADRQQLRQLFLNLFTNASDAMPSGGTLTIFVDPIQGHNAVRIAIQDTGEGIRPELFPQIMEPFFTTKPEGKGTGLGLAICKRIVEEHNGILQINSPGAGMGTRVEIQLPGLNGNQSSFLED
jgi:PAS domain S-box-containing protein